MATLDDDFGYIDPSTVPPYPTAIRYGLIGGLISVVYGLIANLTGLTNPTGGMMTLLLASVVGIVIGVGIIVFAIKHHRDNELGGYISFGRAFILGLIVSLISGLISVAFNYIYMNFIDPNFMSEMMEGMEEMLSNFGVPEEQMEQALIDAEKGFGPTRMLMNTTIGGVVLALIIGAIMKKNRD